MGEFDSSATLVYPVIPDPAFAITSDADMHSTILWFGDVTDVGFTAEDIVKSVRDMPRANQYLRATTTGLENFGVDGEVTVATISHGFLIPFRTWLDEKLAVIGAGSASEFSYSPHITYDSERAYLGIPNNWLLGPPELWWREQKIKIFH